MWSKVLNVAILALFITLTCAGRNFRNGRLKGGNLKHLLQESEDLPDLRKISEEWITQKVDNFNPSNPATWQQKYFVNDALYSAENTKTAYLFIGGEGPASVSWMQGGAWFQFAEPYLPLLFQLEHRYYGDSHPTEDLSTENLAFLSSEQALADTANFISAMNTKYNLTSDTQWIAFGGSYSGSLAAWLRFKYPHLVKGAVSSSGPLLAKLDFEEYLQVVRESLTSHSPDCATTIQQAYEDLEAIITSGNGTENLDELLDLCTPIEDSLNNTLDLSTLYEVIADQYAYVVQYNRDATASVVPDVNIDSICAVLTNETLGQPLERVAAANKLIMLALEEECLDYKYDVMIADWRNVSWESEAAEGWRQWMYQTCTEFGFFQTSSREPHTFGDDFPVEYFTQLCQDTYGETFSPDFVTQAIDRTNVIYGALDIDVTNVVFVHGTIDPWHALGVTSSNRPLAPAILIDGTSHCADMYSPSPEDLPQLKAAREQIQNMIADWLNV